MKSILMNFADNLLSKNEMKNIMGGGSCGYKDSSGWHYGVAKSDAVGMVNDGWATNWCCESCHHV